MVKQMDNEQIEAKLVAEMDTWGEHSQPTAKPIALEELRQRAAKLSDVDKEAICESVASLEPDRGQISQTSWRRGTKTGRRVRRLTATVAACLLLILVAPQMIMAAADLPGIGPMIQKAVFQHAGLKWAYDNGAIQGTMAQVSKGGITLRILGVAADPIQTSVIYVIQGAKPPQARNEKPQPAQKAGDDDPPWPSGPDYGVLIKSIDGVASWSGSDQPVWTQLGYVGVVQTGPLPAAQGRLEIELQVSGASGGPVSVSIPATREAVSKLAQELPMQYEKTVAGITVTGKRVVVTPALLMVEYSVRGGHTVYGEFPPEMNVVLDGPGGKQQQGVGSYLHGFQVDGVWQYRVIYERPEKLDSLQLLVPWLAKDIALNLSWRLDQRSGELNALDVPVQINVNSSVERVSFDLSWPLNDQFGNLSGIEVLDANGRVLSYGMRSETSATVNGNKQVGHSFQLDPSSMPETIRIATAEQNVNGQWAIPLPPLK